MPGQDVAHGGYRKGMTAAPITEPRNHVAVPLLAVYTVALGRAMASWAIAVLQPHEVHFMKFGSRPPRMRCS